MEICIVSLLLILFLIHMYIGMDGFWLDNRMLRASFGTTKYCNFFLRNAECTNSDCLYLHDIGNPANSFTKDQMQSNKTYFQQQTHPGPGAGPQYVVDGPVRCTITKLLSSSLY